MKEKIQNAIEDFRNKSPTQQFMILLPYIVVCFVFVRIFEIGRLCDGNIIKIIYNVEYIIKGPLYYIQLQDLLLGIPAGLFIIWYTKYENKFHRKNTRRFEEYGSARWGNADDIKPFIDENPFYNIILSKTERLTMNPRMKKFELNRNKHCLFYGGSGVGKTFSVVKPNLFQLICSYVLTDPKGTLLPETGKLFEKARYRIKVLDTIDFENSMHYNPFVYIRKPKDILTLANVIFTNLKPPDSGTPPDPFFDQAALLWLQSIIGYLWYEAPPEEQNIPTLMEFLDADEVREDDENYKNAVDMLFEELEKKNPFHFAVRQRKKYKKAAGKTAKSILITLGSYLSPFDIPEVAELFRYDELEFDTYGDPGQKSILYVIISDTDTTFNFISAIMFTQMFNVLCYKADKEMGGKLKTPVMFILDEFANIGKIPNFEILIATIRSRLMSVMLFLQTQSQLKTRYKDAAETIVGNCDSIVFLGGNEKTTLKDLEEMLGDETIDLWNDSKTYSTNESTGINYNKTGRKLKTMAELRLMNRNKCIVQISGLPPFYSDKYNTSEHPNYKYTADYSDKNIFDFQKYRKKLKEKEDVIIRFKAKDQYKVVNMK